MNRDDLELYVLGMYEGDVAALERELATDPAARAIVAEEASLELLLRDAAAAATFCPGCDDLVSGARCDACGIAIRPGGYVVERVLVSNAHGRMYVARDADGAQVALKELAFVQSPTLAAVAAFEREAKFLRALEHPAIPRFRASFQEGSGVHTRYYLAQALVDGAPLDARLDEHFFAEAEIVGIARQVIDVLMYLQGLSPMVIHRDIKPANLLVRDDGTIAVVDFGAAHVQGSTAGSTTIGTFGYMPIEQLAGEVDATTDLYALGASLLHLLTRREPWRILQGGTLDGLNVSRPMRGFLAKLTAAAPRDRFASAVAARAALDRLAAPGRTRAVRSDERALVPRRSSHATGRWTSRPAMVAGAALSVAMLGGGLFGWTKHIRRERHQAEVTRAQTEEILRDLGQLRHELRAPLDKLPPPRRVPDEAELLLIAAGAAERGQLPELARLADEACACSDQTCADQVRLRAAAWSQHRTPLIRLEQPGAAYELTALSARLFSCLTLVPASRPVAEPPLPAAVPMPTVPLPVPASPPR